MQHGGLHAAKRGLEARIQEVRPQTMNNLRALDSDPHGVILGYASHPLIFRHVLVMLRRVRVINQSHSSHDAPRFRRVRVIFLGGG